MSRSEQSLFPRAALALAVTVGLGLSACVKTSNVATFSTALLDTQVELKPVLADGYGSCVRAAEYHMLKQSIDTPAGSEDLTKSDYAAALKKCETAKELREQMLVANETVVLFGKSLGKLADDEAVDYGDALDGLVGSVNTLSGSVGAKKDLDELAGKGFSDATKGALGTLSKWMTSAYRRKQLKKALTESEADIQAVLTATEVIVEEAYVEALYKAEAKSLDELYDRFENVEKGGPAAVGRLRLERQAALEELEQRIGAAESYLEKVENLRAAHGKLVAEAGALDKKELLAEVKVIVEDALAVKKAFDDVEPLSVPDGVEVPSEPEPRPESESEPTEEN